MAVVISGHKTRSVFDRYNIVDERDLHLAAQKLDAFAQRAEIVPVQLEMEKTFSR